MLPRQFTAGLNVCLSLLRSRAEPKLQAWCVFIIKPERTPVTPPGLFLQQQWAQSCWFVAPIQGGWGETAENADHSRLVDDSVNKQETYLQNLSGCKTSRFPYKALPASPRIWKLYIEFLMGFSHIFHPKVSQPLTLSRLCPWNSSQCGHSKQNVHFKDREGVRSLGQLAVLSSPWPPPKKLEILWSLPKPPASSYGNFSHPVSFPFIL